MAGASAGETEDQLVQSQKVLDAQLKALSEVLSPELAQSLSASQQSWITYRDQQCTFDLLFSQDRGRARVDEVDGRNAVCVTQHDQQRVQQLQQYMNQVMRVTRRPAGREGITAGTYMPKSCRLTDLPADFEVHAVGIYKGVDASPVRLGTSNHRVGGANIVVNQPAKPVVLVLMGYDPIVWNISWTKSTKIAAVLVGSYHKQAVLGIDAATTARFYSHEERSNCGYFYAYRADRNLTRANSFVKDLTGREIVDVVYEPIAGRFVVGRTEDIDDDELVTSPERKIEDYTDGEEAPGTVPSITSSDKE